MLEFNTSSNQGAGIKVVGVGGGGCNAVNTMIASQLENVEFIVANTDLQALEQNQAPKKIQLGESLTKGLGAGANPDTGRDAAMESIDRIRQSLDQTDMLFIAAGMGGGTGTGAAPIIAEAARSMGILTVGVVTKPFRFEGNRRNRIAEEGLQQLKEHVDSLIVIPNEKLFSISGKSMSLLSGFKMADEVLLHAIKSIADLINVPGLINLDFADVKTIMTDMGLAFMGIGEAEGENRAAEAARKALSNPLLDDVSITGAQGFLINITGGTSLTFDDLEEATRFIQSEAHADANIIFGAAIEENAGERCRMTIIATGFSEQGAQPAQETVTPTVVAPEPQSKEPTPCVDVQDQEPQPAVAEDMQPELPDMPLEKVRQDCRVVKIGTIISEFSEESQWDIPTFIREKQMY